MGQKVNPHGLRVGIIEGWESKWYTDKKEAPRYLLEDYKIRQFLKKDYYEAAISKIKIERAASTVKIDIFCGRPGYAIGKVSRKKTDGGDMSANPVVPAGESKKGIDDINKNVKKIIGDSKTFNVNVYEVKNQDLDAQIAAEQITSSLERRTPFRRAMKFAIGKIMRAGAKGVKVIVAGRLDGAEIARSETYHEGSIPLQTLRAEIDYGFAEAKTTYGVIGVKVLIYKGEVFNKPGQTGGKN